MITTKLNTETTEITFETIKVVINNKRQAHSLLFYILVATKTFPLMRTYIKRRFRYVKNS